MNNYFLAHWRFLLLSERFEPGQIAAINGNVQYELVVNKDKSTSWVKGKLAK